MINGIPVYIIRPIVEGINRLGVSTSSQIREIALQTTAEFAGEMHLNTIVEDLVVGGWIQNVEGSLDEAANDSWQLTDETRRFFRIRAKTVGKAANPTNKVLFKLIQERAQRKFRKGQSKFRQELLDLYGSRCMISGCIAEQSLEAAHIEPYAYAKCNHRENGLLLRADIHTLFDKLLISVNSSNLTVVVAKELAHSEYSVFQDVKIHPHSSLDLETLKAKLKAHFNEFELGCDISP